MGAPFNKKRPKEFPDEYLRERLHKLNFDYLVFEKKIERNIENNEYTDYKWNLSVQENIKKESEEIADELVNRDHEQD